MQPQFNWNMTPVPRMDVEVVCLPPRDETVSFEPTPCFGGRCIVTEDDAPVQDAQGSGRQPCADSIEGVDQSRAVAPQCTRGDHRYDVLHWLQRAVVIERDQLWVAERAIGREHDGDVDNALGERFDGLRLPLERYEATNLDAVDVTESDQAVAPLRALGRPADDDTVSKSAEIAHAAEREPTGGSTSDDERVLVLCSGRCQDGEVPLGESDSKMRLYRGRVVPVHLGARVVRFQGGAEIFRHDVHETLAHRGLHEFTRTEPRFQTDGNAGIAERIGVDLSEHHALDEVE
jgi:hypothetical protein